MDKNSREFKHDHNNRLCYCCDTLQENPDKLHKLEISCRGYGSSFDNFNSYILLCDKCMEEKYKKWFNECPSKMNEYDYCENYKYEEDIRKLIDTFPLENQEYFWNSNAWGAGANCCIERQDWLDMERGTLPDEKYKEYGMYSPSERKAYEDRFPNCKHVEIKVYDDGSKGSKCFKNAFGDGEGKCGLNMSSECYMCNHFEERDGEIIVVDTVKEFYERETNRLNNMIIYANKRLEMIKNGTLKESD